MDTSRLYASLKRFLMGTYRSVSYTHLQLALFQNRTVLYIDQTMPVNPVSIVAPMHTPIPINITAAGKIICAQLSSEEQQDLLSHETLVQKTPYSISSISALLQNIKSAKQSGYATDIEEYSRCLLYTSRCV